MTGRSWRHFSVFWPFMVAGAVGPADQEDSSNTSSDSMDVAPTRAATHPQAPVADSGTESVAGDAPSDAEADAAGGAADIDELEMPTKAAGGPPGPEVIYTERYKDVFGAVPLHDAVLTTFCRAAHLGGQLFGDNVADTTTLTEAQIVAMEENAVALGVDCIQTLYGHVNTKKLHRLIAHLGDELRGRGNLWEGDTSENERLHARCKRMFRRTNKRGPGVALQMMRCEESQSAVLHELQDADAEQLPEEEPAGVVLPADVTVTGNARGSRRAGGGGADLAATTALPAQTSDISFTGRETRSTVGELRATWALGKVGQALGLGDDDHVTLHKTVRIMARFEWGAPTVMQHLRAANSFIGKSWFSWVLYRALDDGVRWGRLRLVLRSVAGRARSCVVLQRLRRATARPGCVLSEFGCVRLAWAFDSDDAVYPALHVVDAVDILREEDVQTDWYDRAARLGLRSMPSDRTSSAAEWRAARFFTNPFFPWTSRSMRPGF